MSIYRTITRLPKLISNPILLFPTSTFTNNKEILLILKILLILYHWKKAQTTNNCSYANSFWILSHGFRFPLKP